MASLSNFRNQVARSRNERGAVLVLTALVMMLLLFIAAFATDLGAWYRQGQEQQRAADVGSLNGIQAYDRAVKEVFDSLPPVGNPPAKVKNWTELQTYYPGSLAQAEAAGVREAVETVIGLMETSGLTFTDGGVGTIASNPLDITDSSVWTVTATDGTVVIITRSFEVAGADSAGNPRYARAISIEVQAPGEQYFSNILRDAPQIERSAQSVLSNCGAECTRSIVINPPFAGFDAAGSGDGYKPLLRGDTEIWAVNHHIYSGWDGDIICMDREDQSSCGSFSLGGSSTTVGYNTSLRPVELLSNRVDKIYAPSTRRSDNRAGLLCFDVARKQYCTTPFIDFWDSTNRWGSPAAAVWEFNNNAYVLGHHGEMACVTMSADASGGMQSCGEFDTALVGHPRAWTEARSGANKVSWGEIIGNELFLISRGLGNDALFHCVNLASRTPCWGGNVVALGNNYDGSEAMGFIRHATNGAREGYCLAVPQNGDRHYCVNFNGNQLSALPNLTPALVALENSWTGSTFTWEGKRTFFTGGNSDRLSCYDWTTRAYCGEVDLDLIRPGNYEVRTAGPRTGSEEIEPYALSQVTPQCLVGLGDQSYFFSFSPETLDPCVDTRLNTFIQPCTCSDGGNKWGEVRMPTDLLTKVDTLYATVAYTENGTPIAGLNRIPLHTNGGYIDLVGIDDSVDILYLLLEVEAKLGPDGKPVWQSPITADLQIVVQPTLTN